MKKRRVLFYRKWTSYNGGTSGGQLKVRDAYEHIKTSENFEPKVYFDPETIWFDNPGNHWLDLRQSALNHWHVDNGDILFFSGKDWDFWEKNLSENKIVPIINIAQPRHVRTTDPRNSYLKWPAIRIAKSTIGKSILENYGVNGPVHLIPDAIDHEELPQPSLLNNNKILIVGLKNEKMALALKKKLLYYNFLHPFSRIEFTVQIGPKLPTRKDFLNLLNTAEIICFLPLPEENGHEGFYLPALEAMALSKLVICPYAVGNIDFCLPEVTCLQPKYELNELFHSIIFASKMGFDQRNQLKINALQKSKEHSIIEERKKILELINNADEIWSQKHLFSTK